MQINNKINYYQELFFDFFVIITYVLMFISFIGLSNIAPRMLTDLYYYIRIYICLFLIWRFNPFRKIDKFTNLDRKIVFSAGLFILTTTALNKYLIIIQHNIKSLLKL